MLLSVVVLSWNRKAETLESLRSVTTQVLPSAVEVELIVVDSGSTDGAQTDIAQAFPQARLVQLPQNLGVAGGRNVGIKHSRGEIIVFLDNDGRLAPGALAEMVRAFSADTQLGIVTFRVEQPLNGQLDQNCWVYARDQVKWSKRDFETYTFTGGACAIRWHVFQQAGLFWEGFIYAREEEDLALRALDHGFHILYLPSAVMYHYASSERRSGRGRVLALNLANSMLLFARNLPLGMALSLCLGKLLVFTLKSIKEREPLAVPSGCGMFLRGLPRALRERHAIGPEAVRLYRSLNPNSQPTPLAFFRRTSEVLGEGENKSPKASGSSVSATATFSGVSEYEIDGSEERRKAS